MRHPLFGSTAEGNVHDLYAWPLEEAKQPVRARTSDYPNRQDPAQADAHVDAVPAANLKHTARERLRAHHHHLLHRSVRSARRATRRPRACRSRALFCVHCRAASVVVPAVPSGHHCPPALAPKLKAPCLHLQRRRWRLFYL